MRRELELFVPFAALALVGLTVVLLLVHRSGVRDLRDEARTRALRAVDQITIDLSSGGSAETTLRRHAVGAGLALFEPDGRSRVTAGRLAQEDLLAPLTGERRRSIESVGVFGPDRRTGGAVVVIAPIELEGRRLLLRREEPARRLAALSEALPLLTLTVLGASVSLLVLVGLYLRHLLRPFDLLLDRARQVEGEAVDGSDDLDSILRTFDRALEALRDRRAASNDSELAVLERTLLDVESGLLLLDDEGNLLALNKIGSDLLSIPLPVEGRSLEEALERQPELRQRIREAIRRDAPVQRAEIPVHGEGTERIVGLTLNPLRRDDGRIRGWLGMFADLTEARREARSQQLGESLHHVGEVTAGLAHELRNGLASLRGYLTLIERGDPSTREDLTDYLAEFRREVDDLHRVTEDFLDFARPGNIAPERLQPERIAHRAAADPALSRARIRVETDDSAREVVARGDPHLIGRALRNLLDNAARAQAETGASQPVELRVEGGPGGDTLRFRVLDRGPGLAPEVKERLFVPFVTTSPGGAGLGLSLALRIARLHGGGVELRERDDGGVEAILELPADAIVTHGDRPA